MQLQIICWAGFPAVILQSHAVIHVLPIILDLQRYDIQVSSFKFEDGIKSKFLEQTSRETFVNPLNQTILVSQKLTPTAIEWYPIQVGLGARKEAEGPHDRLAKSHSTRRLLENRQWACKRGACLFCPERRAALCIV